MHVHVHTHTPHTTQNMQILPGAHTDNGSGVFGREHQHLPFVDPREPTSCQNELPAPSLEDLSALLLPPSFERPLLLAWTVPVTVMPTLHSSTASRGLL